MKHHEVCGWLFVKGNGFIQGMTLNCPPILLDILNRDTRNFRTIVGVNFKNNSRVVNCTNNRYISTTIVMVIKFQKAFTELISIIELREYNKLSGPSIEAKIIQHYLEKTANSND
ncbi:MAG TPA: hypothetical protein VFT15_16700 [Chitinophagaceae bacterium]|nr:hypothetical protein [Chitinophagaceae bacterium]